MGLTEQKSYIEKYSFIFIIALFFVDIVTASFFEQPFVHGVLTLYIVLLLRKSTSIFMCSFPLALLALESFFLYSRFDITFIYLIPIIFLAIQAQQMFHVMQPVYYFFLLACLCTKFFIIEPYFLQVSVTLPFIMISIMMNMLVMFFFLKLMQKNKKGYFFNRPFWS
jgi:hypothetical protein